MGWYLEEIVREFEVKPRNTSDAGETGFVMGNTQSQRILVSYDIHGLRTVVFSPQISGNYSFHLMYVSKTVPVNSLPSYAVSTQMAATWMRQSRGSSIRKTHGFET